MPEKKTWHVRSIETSESVHEMTVDANLSDRQEERRLSGRLRTMDRERFYVDTGDDESDAD